MEGPLTKNLFSKNLFHCTLLITCLSILSCQNKQQNDEFSVSEPELTPLINSKKGSHIKLRNISDLPDGVLQSDSLMEVKSLKNNNFSENPVSLTTKSHCTVGIQNFDDQTKVQNLSEVRLDQILPTQLLLMNSQDSKNSAVCDLDLVFQNKFGSTHGFSKKGIKIQMMGINSISTFNLQNQKNQNAVNSFISEANFGAITSKSISLAQDLILTVSNNSQLGEYKLICTSFDYSQSVNHLSEVNFSEWFSAPQNRIIEKNKVAAFKDYDSRKYQSIQSCTLAHYSSAQHAIDSVTPYFKAYFNSYLPILTASSFESNFLRDRYSQLVETQTQLFTLDFYNPYPFPLQVLGRDSQLKITYTTDKPNQELNIQTSSTSDENQSRKITIEDQSYSITQIKPQNSARIKVVSAKAFSCLKSIDMAESKASGILMINPKITITNELLLGSFSNAVENIADKDIQSATNMSHPFLGTATPTPWSANFPAMTCYKY